MATFMVSGDSSDWSLLESNSLEDFCKDPASIAPPLEILNEHLPNGETLLTYSIKNNFSTAVPVLLEHGADPHLVNKKGSTPLSVAAKKGNIQVMEVLLQFGCSVQIDSLNATGSTALLQAAHFGQLESVKFLIDHGVDCTIANTKGTTALMRAAQEGHMEIVKCLLDCKVGVNDRNKESMTALMLAAQRGHADVVELLVNHGAELDGQTGGHWRAMGSSALMLACHRGQVECVEVLLRLGAKTHLRDHEGLTALGVTLKKRRKIQEGRTTLQSKVGAVGKESTEEQRETEDQYGVCMLLRLAKIAELLKGAEVELKRHSGSFKDALDPTVTFVEELSLSTDWVPVERTESVEEEGRVAGVRVSFLA